MRVPGLSGEGRLPGAARAAINSLPRIRVEGPAGRLPRASLADNAQLNALVFVPNVLQGVFRRRRAAVRVPHGNTGGGTRFTITARHGMPSSRSASAASRVSATDISSGTATTGMPVVYGDQLAPPSVDR